MTRQPKAIVVVTLDSARPDHLGCSGYRGVDTPYIDRLAESGIFYTQAIAQATNTWVSHATIFTGCNPYRHGVRTEHSRLAPDLPTLAESLSRAGYATAGFPAHTLVGPARGFGRGFDHYDLDMDDFVHASWETRYYREWNSMWSRAKAWMEAQEKPVFVWLHYMGTHWEPHEALSLPRAYRERYSPYGQYFDGKTSWADRECVGAIWDYLEERKILDDTLLVVLSDHGDDLPHNDPPYRNGGHNSNLHDVVTRVVLAIRAPGWSTLPSRVTKQVRTIDIMPTLLELASVGTPDSVEGTSVLPATPGSGALRRGTETTYAYMENLPRGWLGIRTEEWKLILTINPPLESKLKIRVMRVSDWKMMMVDNPSARKRGLTGAVARLGRALVEVGRASMGLFRRAGRRMPEWLRSGTRSLVGGAALAWAGVARRLAQASVPDGPSDAADLARSFERETLESGRVFALYHLPSDRYEKRDVSAEHPAIVRELMARLRRMTAGVETQIQEVGESDRKEIEERLKALGYML